MRLAKYTFYSLLLALLVLVTSCSSTTDPGEAYHGETAEQIFQGGEDALRDKNYAEAIKRFEALDAQYPFGRNAETAQLHIIYAYYMNSDYVSAEAAADRFIHAHPTNPHVDYAYYMRGLSNYYQNMGVFERLFRVDFATRDLTQVKKSFNDFNQLQTHYPNSSFAPAAHQYTIYLRNVVAKHQLEVAQYYFSREAYVASADRASIVVQHYQGTPSVPDALVLMAKSYYQLHLTDQLNQTIQVINYNYPDSKYMEKVSGRKLQSKSFSVVARKDVVVPVQRTAMIPPADGRGYYQNYAANGGRGGVTTVADLVKEVRASGVFAMHPKQNAEPVTAQQQSTQRTQAAEQSSATQTQASAQSAPAPQASAESQSNGSRNSAVAGGMTLNNVLESLSSSVLFSSHSKTKAVNDAAAQPAATQQATTQRAPQQLAEAAPPQQVVSTQGNGARR
jgi:outer membrane protein assembly factor BamD